MKLTIHFCITSTDETRKEVIQIDSERKSTLPNPGYKTIHKQRTINEEQVIKQLRRKKAQEYQELKFSK